MITQYKHYKIAIEAQYIDYAAYLPDEYDGAEDSGPQMVGWGKTQDAALAELIEMIDERDEGNDQERFEYETGGSA